MAMKALVTGASGFIGSTLIGDLAASGIEVYALMRKTSSAANLEGLKYKRVEGDLSDPVSLRHAVQSMDLVFHLAGAIAAPNREAYFEHNAHGTQRLAQAVAETRPGLTRFVYVSSLAAAGPARSLKPRTEDEPEGPVSFYGASKLQGEKELLKYKDVFPISIVRPPLVYGPKDKGVFVVIQTVAKNLMPIMRGSTEGGHKYYSAIHANDLSKGILQAGLASRDRVASGEIFYMTGDGVHTYQDLLASMARALGKKPFRFPVPKFAITAAAYGCALAGRATGRTYALNLDKLNELLPDYWICSNQKARSVLGFTPEFDLNTGMSHAIEWYKRKNWL